MIRKEIEEKIKELQAQLETLVDVTYGELKAGDTFLYKGHEFTKLRNGEAVINSYYADFMHCQFDNVDNEYIGSLIYYYVADKLIRLLKLDKSDFVDSEVRPVASLLSEEEYEENKDIIKNFVNGWWLRSGDCDYNNFAYYVYSNGDVSSDYVYSGFGVRPMFSFKDDVAIEVVNE